MSNFASDYTRASAALLLRVGIGLLVILLPHKALGSAEQGEAPMRIIALSPHAVELLFVLGAGDWIVATTEYADFPEAAKEIPRVGGYHGIQIERVLELEPDLIVAWEGGNRDEDIAQMERLSLPVYKSRTQSLGDIAVELERLGALIGLEREGRLAAQSFKAQLEEQRRQHQHKQPVRFFYQLWTEPLKTMAAGSWINELMTTCGGENIFNDNALDYPQVSKENVLVLAPEAIVVPSHHGAVIEAGSMWQAWPEIPAVANQHIFFINGDILHRFSIRVLEGIAQVCDAFDQVRALNTAEGTRVK